ncbi:hypothetical protein BC939DRAFT_457816 [Gamsiella multidivaricata]|uniref:uncharacterized protein n=1 Tax=Gamsiella multidivaricata TaxID=101098 RepID=UPI00221FA9A1|nr:uncharacterized protein BC939DRAFT_457816 [Gamsiella multidivaricata]KAG0363930.1 hypothetical protein BGZ54_007964 [Gamsiella multidivaricata]KAI7820381.1 hypothetical protein BC939DRAFT_457816 [Gamsiella multidivaricata]
MIKNIGKFKQWTGEKMGKGPKARMDEDFHSLTSETEAKRVALEKLSETSHAYLKAISKRVEGDDKHKGLAIETFGMSMSAQSYTVREGSQYRGALQRMGDAHQNIGAAQLELISRFNSSYLDSLEKSQAQMKEYQALQRKLLSRRQDYDAKLAKVQKAKKEKPEWEEEMQASKAKYEETRENVLNLMYTINESQDDNLISLKSYYDAQLAYARKMVEILEAIPENTFMTSPNGSRLSLYAGNGTAKKLSGKDSQEPEDERSNLSDDQSSTQSIPNGRHPFDRTPSTADLRRSNMSQHLNPELSRSMSHLTPNAAQTRKNSSGGSIRSNGLMASPAVPSRGRTQKQVRALYTFDATGEGELSIQKGDIIRIVEEIDEGWWEGELVDTNGVRHTGMFPSNYCEEVMSDSGSTHRQGSIHSNSSDPGRYMDEDEAAYYERETEPTIHYAEPEEETVPPVPVTRRAPPPPVRQASHMIPASNGSATNGHANGTARATPPQARPVSTLSPMNRTSTLGTRMPPPPPPTRRAAVESMRHSAVFSNSSTPAVSPPLVSAGPSPPPTAVPSTPSTASMMGYIPKDYFSNQALNPAEADMGPCRECQCTDFSANVFKRGSCNNCFHIH